jgi:hypothetical protein
MEWLIVPAGILAIFIFIMFMVFMYELGCYLNDQIEKFFRGLK